MGSINSKSSHENNCSNTLQIKHYNRFSSLSRLQSLLSSCHHQRDDNDFQCFNNKERSCSKKKVLILGLDGVGKTELFTRLICYDKKRLKIDSLPRPTIGYNVETIKLRCHHLYHRQYHKITLWDCGGQSSVRSLWSYHYSNTSLLLWLINIYDRSRLDTNLHLLSQILTNPIFYRVPVLIVLYNSSLDQNNQEKSDENTNQDLLTNLEISFRFLATLSTSRASTFKWQVIDITLDENDSQRDFKKIRQSFRELMEL
ncbi:unnamed protein product [Rotaria sordida]|uniref:Uncharacterized protein n=1 Tax=Rotaria sordida TaxID=392033 RepID=A0A814NJ38_9BILA|nr:unnamed protein product [Rotaria sordida]CAF1125169.1 unnamed protein product [Rotaria sordida]CAF1345023.1 unnamed protein product [Rotaria sordida]CAF3926464.1 unnamed protein product [Rotaria sordida]